MNLNELDIINIAHSKVYITLYIRYNSIPRDLRTFISIITDSQRDQTNWLFYCNFHFRKVSHKNPRYNKTVQTSRSKKNNTPQLFTATPGRYSSLVPEILGAHVTRSLLFIHLWLPGRTSGGRLNVSRLNWSVFVADSPGSSRPFPITSTSRTTSDTTRRLPLSTWTGKNLIPNPGVTERGLYTARRRKNWRFRG